jgi:hypothetical protein
MKYNGMLREVWNSVGRSSNIFLDFQESKIRNRKLEVYYTAEGLRSVGLGHVYVKDDPILYWIRHAGLKVKTVGVYKVYSGFTYFLEAARPGDRTVEYVVFGKKEEELDEMIKAFHVFDNDTMGRLLGYPKCCVEAFKSRWPNEKDTVLRAAMDSVGQDESSKEIHLNDICFTNVFLRYSGHRYIPHLPCSFYCSESENIGKKMMQLEESVFGESVLKRILSLPLTVSMYRGISEVTSEWFKIVVGTDFTKEKYTIYVK